MTTPAEPVPTRAGDEVRVGRLSAGDVPGAARLLATVFREEPSFLDLFPPDSPGRGQALLHLHAGLLRSALSAGHVLAARQGLEVAGVAVWLPPAAAPLPLRRQLRALPDTFAMLAAAPRSLPRLLRLVGALSRLHPPSPHWCLAALAVDPRLRGRGVGAGSSGTSSTRPTARSRRATWRRRPCGTCPGTPGSASR